MRTRSRKSTGSQVTGRHRPSRSASLVPLVAVTAAAVVFTIMLVLVRLRWTPLESADHAAAAWLNALVAGHTALITVITAVTSLGGDLVLAVVVSAAVIFLAFRRRWRLTVYLIATATGAFVLEKVLKSLVGRLRPVVAHPISHGTGNSFPSGHALSSIVCYGALLLIFLPVARGRWRTAFIAGTVAVVALIGISRILLGVHFVSDVVGGWAVGISWLGVTAVAFELARHAVGLPVTAPVTEGLEPQDQAGLELARSETADPGAPPRSRGRTAAALLVAWVLVTGVITGIGELVTRYGGGNALGDRVIPRWLAAHHTAALTHWSQIFSDLGGTAGILAAALAVAVVCLAVIRRWRPVAYLAVILAGELGTFLIAAAIVQRPRPSVPHLDHRLPTSSYPSGHTAATCCLYGALAILVIGQARGWWRWLFLVPAIVMPVLVAASRIYRGEHHPTDVLGGMLLAALWLIAATRIIRPSAAPRVIERVASHDGSGEHSASDAEPANGPSRRQARLAAR